LAAAIEARHALIYDLVTISDYLPKKSMALTVNGTTKWASAKELQQLGERRMRAKPTPLAMIRRRGQ
jgi:serine/threonine-protein kinase HipA